MPYKDDKKRKEYGKQYCLRRRIKIVCCICGKDGMAHRKTQKCCSIKCSSILRSRDENFIQKIRDANKKLLIEGRHVGWRSRNILSYPEKFFITVLDNNNLKYKVNDPFMGYFLDFSIKDKMIDLEIDGKQHKYPNRKNSDDIRDKILTANGWKVYRIEWNNINTDGGKVLMKEKIDKFLDFYKCI